MCRNLFFVVEGTTKGLILIGLEGLSAFRGAFLGETPRCPSLVGNGTEE